MSTDAPKPAMIIKGEPWWLFGFEYDFDGSTYAFDVPARSEAEAHERMKKIALARYRGLDAVIAWTEEAKRQWWTREEAKERVG